MAALHLTRRSSAPPDVLWDVVTDFAGHAAYFPATRMELDPGEPRLGWALTAVSGVGPLRLTDPMLVTAWDAPTPGRPEGSFRLVKTGRVLAGWAEVSVRPDGEGSLLDWAEDVTLRLLPTGLTGPLVRPTSSRLYGRVVDGMVAEAERRAGA